MDYEHIFPVDDNVKTSRGPEMRSWVRKAGKGFKISFLTGGNVSHTETLSHAQPNCPLHPAGMGTAVLADWLWALHCL